MAVVSTIAALATAFPLPLPAIAQTTNNECITYIDMDKQSGHLADPDEDKPENDYTYEPEECVAPEDLKSSGPIACRQIKDSLKELEKYTITPGRGEEHARIPPGQKDKEEWYGYKGPEDYRKVYPPSDEGGMERAWARMVADSLRTLDLTEHNMKQWERFFGCLEPRKIVDTGRYKSLCEANCPTFVRKPALGALTCSPCEPPPTPVPVVAAAEQMAGEASVLARMILREGDEAARPQPDCHPKERPECQQLPPGECVRQEHELYSYYLPVYTFIMGKDGHRFLDPMMFNPGNQKREDLKLDSIKSHHQQHIQSDILPQLKKKGIASELFEPPWWYSPDQRFFLESWLNDDGAPMTYAMSVGGLRTNWVSRLSDSKLPGTMHHGYDLNSLCMAWAAPEETQIRKVITNYMEAEDLLNNIQIFPEFTAEVDKEKYDYAHFFQNPDMFDAAKQVDEGSRKNLTKVGVVPRWRRWKWPGGEKLVPGWTGDECGSGFDDLDLVGIDKEEGDVKQGDVIYWAFETSPFTNVEYWANPLHQAIGNTGRASLVLGSKNPKLRNVNTYDIHKDIKRHLTFTYYKDRYKDPFGVSYLNTRFQHTNDKNQCCGGSCMTPCCGRDLVGLDKFQIVFPPLPANRGSECFELNSVPRQLQDANWPKSLLTFIYKHGLVHITQWEYRVACACQWCGMIQGCLTLDRGDFEEDLPEGKEKFPEGGWPESMKRLMPQLEEFAKDKAPYGNPPLCPCECHVEYDYPGQKKGKAEPIQEMDMDYCPVGEGKDRRYVQETKSSGKKGYEEPNCHVIVEENKNGGGGGAPAGQGGGVARE